jgi:hypothetical protein
MADTDKLVKVGQLDTIVDEIVDKFGETNGRLTQLSFSLSTDENGNVILVRDDLEDLSEVTF